MGISHRFAFILACALVTSVIPGGASLGASGSPWDADPVATAQGFDPGANAIEDGLLDTDTWPHGVIVHTTSDEAAAIQATPGFEPLYAFENLPAVYGLATDASVVRILASNDAVTNVEDAWKPITYLLDSASIASRVREVLDPAFDPLTIDEPSPAQLDGDGNPLDGSGVGIAVVDSGIDGTHPDLNDPGKIQASYLTTPSGVVELPATPVLEGPGEIAVGGAYSELGTSHGTFVAGIAAGTGDASDGAWRSGVAPGASLYSFAGWARGGPTIADTTLAPAIAFDWILSHGDDQDPPIKVVANAWSCQAGACNELDPGMAHIQLASDLAEAGTTVVFAAGNSGGEGFATRTTPECQLQTRGVLCIGNHDDEETGSRTDCVKSTSSRGDAFDPTTWPDLIAPGDDVWSPNAMAPTLDPRVPAGSGAADPTGQRKDYLRISGTSAATGHIAGVVALLLQANPDLSPDEIEYALKATAHKLPHGDDGSCIPYVRADSTHLWDGANFAAGHGLVDAMDAVTLARTLNGLPAPPTGGPEAFPADWLDHEIALTNIDHTFYLDGEDGLTLQQPIFAAPSVRALRFDDGVVHTSAPLADTFTVSAARVTAWIATTTEFDVILNTLEMNVKLERLPKDDGAPEVLMEDEDLDLQHIFPGQPSARNEEVFLDAPVTFEAGDRVRLTIQGGPHPNGATFSPALGNWLLYSDAQPFPSMVELGEATSDIAPGSVEACLSSSACARLGGDFNFNAVQCETDSLPMHVVWTGPPGSRATLDCYGDVATCEIPSDLDAEVGTCWAETAKGSIQGGHGQCTYTIPGPSGPELGGEGHCGHGYAEVR